MTTKNDAKSRKGILRNLGSESVNLITPTVSALPVNKTSKEIMKPKNDENVNFMLVFI
jgi:hypothetical protein